MVRSQKSVLLALAAFFCCIVLASANTCQVSVTQTVSSRWNDGSNAFIAVNAVIQNTGSSDVQSLTLTSAADFDSTWSIVSNNGEFSLPDYQSSIAAGASYSFGYIVKSDSQADFSVSSVQCADGSVGNASPVSSSPTQSACPTSPPTQAPGTSGHGATAAPTTKPTSAPTSKPTSAPTSAPTSKPTKAPTTKPTKKPTSAPTEKPTKAPTSAPTSKPTTAPTSKPTTAPTSKPTTAPTSKPTTAPTSKPTTAPTTKPSSSSSGSSTGTSTAGGRMCSAGQVWAPAPGTTWQWQLTGTIDTSIDVQMYDIDLFDNTAATIATLHSQGKAVICYFSTQYEDWRPDASSWPASVLGHGLDGWPGENYVDITSPIVRSIMQTRLDLAVTKGCDGVEPDNVDEYENDNGLGITAADQLDFNAFIASEAHARGLSVGLKNDLDQVKTLVGDYDWALDEQCNEYSECDSLTPFVTAGKAVFGVEYEGEGQKAATFCPKMVAAKFSWLLKDMDLTAEISAQCCTYATGGCATKPAGRCYTPTAKRSIEAEAVEAQIVVEDAELTQDVEYSAAATIAYPAAAMAVVALAILF